MFCIEFWIGGNSVMLYDEKVMNKFKELIEEIKVDKTITPYNNFASKMEFIEAYQIMGMLYTFSSVTSAVI